MYSDFSSSFLQIYKATMDAARDIHSVMDMRTISFEVQKSHMVTVTTDIIEEEMSDDEVTTSDAVEEQEVKVASATQKIASDRLGIPASEESPTAVRKEENVKEGPTTTNGSGEANSETVVPRIKYPVGSVVATVTVFYRGIETIEFKLPSNISSAPGSESELIKQSRKGKFSVQTLFLFIYFCSVSVI